MDRASTLPEMGPLWEETLGWQPNKHQVTQFQQFYECILAGNSQLNLTRITEPLDFWEKHLWDSLRGVRQYLRESNTATLHSPLSSSLRAIDIGTGAGFPGVPIAIALPAWTITLLDSTSKKINFLQTALQETEIQNVNTLVDRVEKVGRLPNHREHYDLALVRAVAVAPVCAEYTLPLLKLNGAAILYRGQWTEEEAIALKSVVGQLGGTIETIDTFVTPLTQGTRHCIHLRKISPTPAEFPRPVGIPTQKPLG